MSQKNSPALIAREALKQLASRSLPPTPANFQALYNEIAGLPNAAGFPEAPLRQIAQALDNRGDHRARTLQLLDLAIGRRNWREVQEALVAYTAGAEAEAHRAGGLDNAFLQGIAQLIDNLLPAVGDEDGRFTALAADFLAALRHPAPDPDALRTRLAGLAHRALLAAEEQVELRESLRRLLHLVLENIGRLSLDDRWLSGQVDALLHAVAPPLTLRRLDDVERRVRDVMQKQVEARDRAEAARDELRRMLGEFIARLADMGESSSAFEGRLEESTRKLEEVTRIEDLAPLLAEVIGATRAMGDETRQARTRLQTLQTRVEATEAELQRLHRELDTASAQARHDPLTDTLNRKGLDEALEREVANMRRKEQPLSLALLDVDNFKQLNDRLGHETGDAALLHLVHVTRDSMRPADTLARYGGEEFVILMPDTTLEQGIAAMTRLQRELTKTFFLAGEEHVLITFSAGVAQFTPEETAAEVLRRADQAMYLAKRAGKNRVLGG